MKSNFFTITIMILLLFGLFSGILNEICTADENQAEISFVGEPTYTLTKRIVKNEQILGWTFKIDVKLQNNGEKKSDQLVVNLTDQEGFTLTNYTYIESGETKTISFIWSTTSSTDQQISVNYFPANLGTYLNQYNSGSTKFTILVEGKDALPATSTPGFEIILVFMAVIIFLFYRKKTD